MSLKFINAEKRESDTVIFPSFNLTINKDKITAIFTSINIRRLLIDLFLGETSLSAGDITVDEQSLHKKRKQIGFLLLNNGYYERLTVEETIKFYIQLYHSDLTVNQLLQKLQLENLRKKRAQTLTYSEKKRLQFACLLAQQQSILIMEELDQNIDVESKQIFQSILEQLKNEGKLIIMLTGSLESAVTTAQIVYQLDERGLRQVNINEDEERERKELEGSEISTEKLVEPFTLEKIPTKVNEKIVLFDPPEIDYIESIQGKSYVYINDQSFHCTFTLIELEDRLAPFGFFRCHRSYIVNLQKVREVISWTRNSFSLVLDNKEKSTIPLSKTKMSQLKERLRF